MYRSPSPLDESARKRLAEALNDRLADGLDLHSQIKVAHWNIRGPQFTSLHPLFETMAVGLAAHNDAIAERAVTLGYLARGTTRHVASVSAMVYAGLALGVGAGPFVMGLLRTQMPLTRLFALSAVQPIAAVILAGFVLLHRGDRSATR